MSSDGCQTVAWKGQAFSYLLHHPSDPSKVYSYGRTEPTEEPSSESRPQNGHQAASGTWDGPAPKGFLAAQQRGSTLTPTAETRPVRKFCRVGQQQMPLLSIDAQSMEGANIPASVQAALQAGCVGICLPYKEDGLANVATCVSPELLSRAFTIFSIPCSASPEQAQVRISRAMEKLGLPHISLVVLEQGPASSQLRQVLMAKVQEGKVRGLALAGASLEDVEALKQSTGGYPAAIFAELHPLHSQRKLVGQLLRKGIQAVAHVSHLPEVVDNAIVGKVAQEAGRSALEVVLKWSTQRGTPVVVDAATAAGLLPSEFFQWSLNEEKHKVLLDALDTGKSLSKQ